MKFTDWLDENHPRFVSLTETVELIVRSLLKDAGIQYLTVSGRTKPKSDCLSKAKRKSYSTPVNQMTDISGIRVVVYFDYDVEKVSKLIEDNFSVDVQNSLNKDEALSINEVGYRSVHYVCELGEIRGRLQENKRLEGLKFEVQVRTALQHAWAELAHDRNYKFNGQLPKHIERKLFLLAGLMETADNGFSELSREIDDYIALVSNSTASGSLEIEINSLSLEEFVRNWAKQEGFNLREHPSRDGYADLLRELHEFGVGNLSELSAIIPRDFVKNFGKRGSSIYGIVRDWMIISDPERFLSRVTFGWSIQERDLDFYRKYLSSDEIGQIASRIEIHDFDVSADPFESYEHDGDDGE